MIAIQNRLVVEPPIIVSVHRNGVTQSVTQNAHTKIAFDVVEYNTNSYYDTATYTFTPKIEGVYQVNGSVYLNSASGELNLILYKNNSTYKRGMYGVLSQSVLSAAVWLNGITDYIDLRVYATKATPVISGDADSTFFQIIKVA